MLVMDGPSSRLNGNDIRDARPVVEFILQSSVRLQWVIGGNGKQVVLTDAFCVDG
jgi:hypothetical protein